MDLISELERAEAGSRELDCQIHEAIEGHRREVPHYTTSLDAALPNEKIVFAMKRQDTWAAYSQTDDGDEIQGVGKTEAIARRIAALKARA